MENSILSDKNKVDKVLDYHVKLVNRTQDIRKCIFETEVRDFTNLREHCN